MNNYLQDVFRLTKENEQNREKLENTVQKMSTAIDVLIRPSLNEEQNEQLSTALEEIVTVCTDCAFQTGYNTALRSLATGMVLTDPPTFQQQ